MLRRSLNVVVPLAAFAVMLTGCAGEPSAEDGERAANELRSSVVDDVREVAGILRGSDIDVEGARGQFELCSGDGLTGPTYQYGATVRTGPSDVPTAERIASIAERLMDAGWEDTTPDPPAASVPYAQVRRDDVSLTVTEETDRAGRLLDDGSLSLGMSSRCVRVASEQVGVLEGVEDIDLEGR